MTKIKKETSELFIKLFIYAGISLLLIAVTSPLIVKFYYDDKVSNYKTIADLGPIGDFIGGTTVSLLTASSVLLLLATIIMQRIEIKISQKGIDELTKQTSASIKQAEEAKNEVMITNETMKKQQFETTFFNMISIQRDNSDKLKSENKTFFENLLKNLTDSHYKISSSIFKKDYLKDDYDEVAEFIGCLKIRGHLNAESVQLGIKTEIVQAFKDIDLREFENERRSFKIIDEYYKFSYDLTNEDFAKKAYEEFEFHFNEILHSYFNTFLVSIKFVSESNFERDDQQDNTNRNSIYRELLFSQFSLHEMMLIYYFAKYSSNSNDLIDTLKAYGVFYPKLSEEFFVFKDIDKTNINTLKQDS